MLPSIKLKPERDKAVLRHHPWLFSGAIAHIDDAAADGGLADVYSSRGEWLSRGYVNRRSQIVVRILSWDRAEVIDREFWRTRLTRAFSGRADLLNDPQTTAYRLIFAESDGLPGLIVDRYADWLVLQALTLGIERRKEELISLLVELLPEVRGIFERSDVDARAKEGLDLQSGRLWGEEPPDHVEILENGYAFLVDVRGGQKTGFFLDQRDNRNRLSAHCANAKVLNAFSYTGAFGVYALGGGAAHVINVDTSAEALQLAQRQVQLNRLDAARAEFQKSDVFAQIRAYRAMGQEFDVIVLDPPAFATSRSHIERGARGYKDINWIALQILRRGGALFTFSCSAHVSRELFQKIVFGAAIDAGRDVQIVANLGQASDHPVLLYHPEAAYLKGFICRVW
jgi:23S rRNA (cytosine1962-C5)-methyltransferase